MAVLFGAKVFAFCAFIIYMELFLIRSWNAQLDKLVEADSFLSLIDITPFLTGNTESLQMMLGPNRLMFFLVASGRAKTSPRQVCAIESASHHNPSMTILVVFVQPATEMRLDENLALIEVVRCWPNVRLATINATAAMIHAGLDRLVEEIPSGSHPKEHTSDVLRVLLVLKLGGVYADLDLVTLNSLQSMVHNEDFVVGEDFDCFSSCFFGFQQNHFLVERMLDTMREDFNNTSMHNFGQLALTGSIESYCKMPTRQLLLGRKCSENDVLVLNFTMIGQCHENNYLNDVTDEVYENFSKKYVAFHLSHKLSSTLTKLPVESLSLYGRAIKSFCPISLSASGDTF